MSILEIKYLGICLSKYPHLNLFNSKPLIRNLFLENSIIPYKAKRIIENPEMCFAINTFIQKLDCKMLDSKTLTELEKENDALRSIFQENPTEDNIDQAIFIASISSKLIIWSFIFEPPDIKDLREIFSEINVDTEFVIDLAASSIDESNLGELGIDTDSLKMFLYAYSEFISQDSLDSLLDIYNKLIK